MEGSRGGRRGRFRLGCRGLAGEPFDEESLFTAGIVEAEGAADLFETCPGKRVEDIGKAGFP